MESGRILRPAGSGGGLSPGARETMTDLFRYLRELVDIPSVTGDERALAERVGGDLAEAGLQVTLDEAAPGRPNVVARAGSDPVRLWFCTHLDTVPPFFPSNETPTGIGGRGSCDAKGMMAAMVFAARQLRADGVSGFGLALTVGEEVDSLGARRLEDRGPAAFGGSVEGPVHLVVGEPTEGRMASGHKGTLRVRIRARGKAAHSAYPEAGDSAIHRLLRLIARLQALDWGESPILGPATMNVGLISGGIAGNVFAPSAEATIYWRPRRRGGVGRGAPRGNPGGRPQAELPTGGEERCGLLPHPSRLRQRSDVLFHRHSLHARLGHSPADRPGQHP